jgi:hypothetical protein
MDGQGQLNRNDLMLMMDSYKNSVEMYTVIMEHLKNLASVHLDHISSAQKQILDNQSIIIPLVKKVLEDMINHLVLQRDSMKEIVDRLRLSQEENLEEMQKNIDEGYDNIIKKIDTIQKNIDDSIKEHIKNEGQIQVRFNRLYAALSGVIIALIGALATAYAKMVDLDKLIYIMNKIVEHLGIIIK